MKIGEFAKKTSWNESTIRYYINHGLLGPSRKNGQYVFEEHDLQVAQRINELKEAGLSLEEISKFLLPLLLSEGFNEVFADEQKDILKRKLQEIQKEQEALTRQAERIQRMLQEKPVLSNKLTGFPLEALSYLRCPLCGEELKLKDGVLDRNGVSSAKLCCSACGEELVIIDGILCPIKFLDRYQEAASAPLQDDSGEWGNQKESSLEKQLAAYQRKFFKALEEYSARCAPKVFLLTDADNSILLLRCLEKLPADCLIFVQGGTDLPAIKKIYSDFQGHLVAYLFTDIHKLPLQKACLDGISRIVLPGSKPASLEPYLKENGTIFSTDVNADGEVELKY